MSDATFVVRKRHAFGDITSWPGTSLESSASPKTAHSSLSATSPHPHLSSDDAGPKGYPCHPSIAQSAAPGTVQLGRAQATMRECAVPGQNLNSPPRRLKVPCCRSSRAHTNRLRGTTTPHRHARLRYSMVRHHPLAVLGCPLLASQLEHVRWSSRRALDRSILRQSPKQQPRRIL